MLVKKCYSLLALVIFASLSNCDSTQTIVKKRTRRYLSFSEKSVVFVRLNTKHNMVMETRIYAQGTGFRVNFPLPKKPFRPPFIHKLHRRALYDTMEEMLMHHGFDGRACVLKTLCEASRVATPQSNILLKLYKRVFTIPEGDDKYYPYLKSEECDELARHCPLTLLEMTRYTDD